MARVTRIAVFGLAKLQALVWAAVGLMAGVVYAFGGLVIDTLVTLGWVNVSETPGLSVGTILAFGALVGMPLLFSLVGFALGVLEALIFNLIAPRLGGVDLGLTKK